MMVHNGTNFYVWPEDGWRWGYVKGVHNGTWYGTEQEACSAARKAIEDGDLSRIYTVDQVISTLREMREVATKRIQVLKFEPDGEEEFLLQRKIESVLCTAIWRMQEED